jgi:hypothetical protein
MYRSNTQEQLEMTGAYRNDAKLTLLGTSSSTEQQAQKKQHTASRYLTVVREEGELRDDFSTGPREGYLSL